ncbi:hypothetical protein ACWD25_28440 [Streptomyces sp. NPDC002920]
MPEIKPDLSDESRCVSVHWNLPVQCVLPRSHRENWHEAWHPQTGNRLRYRRSMGACVTEELNDGWRDLQIPPPGGYCNDQYVGWHAGEYRSPPTVRCTGQYGHGWNHGAVVDGCTYSWNTPIPKGITADQLTRDVQQLRGMLVEAHTRIGNLEKDSAELAARARRVAASHSAYMDDLVPGAEALAAQYELINRLAVTPVESELPLNPVEQALRLVLARLDEWQDDITPGEIRSVIAEALPRTDLSDKRRRIYIDGHDHAWIDAGRDPQNGEQDIAGISDPWKVKAAADVRAEAGSLREIGRCW